MTRWLRPLVVAASLSAAVAAAQEPSVDLLDARALQAYHELDLDRALATLDQALARPELTPRVRARLLVHRGVVLFAGLGRRTDALDVFTDALVLDPEATLEASLSSPELQSAFETARQRALYRRTRPEAAPAAGSRRPSATASVTEPPRAAVPPPSPAPSPADAAAAGVTPADAQAVVASDDDAAIDTRDGSVLAPEAGVPQSDDAVGDEDASDDDDGPATVFYQLGYGFGAAYAAAHLETDRPVPYDPSTKPTTWNPNVNGAYAPPGYTEAEWATTLSALWGAYLRPGVDPGGEVIGYDPDCEADGGYCGRVTNPGFTPTSGMRVTLGYWFTDRFALATEWRFQTFAGIGTFGRVIGSLRAHVRLTAPRRTGLSVSAFAGGGFGQMQVRPDQGRYVGPDLCEQGTVALGERCDGPTNPTPSIAYVRNGEALKRPFLQTGPYVAMVGVDMVHHLNPTFGLYARPTIYVLMPAVTYAGELALGFEVAF